MRWKRLFYYLLINILVSACTMVAVLYAWERYRPQQDSIFSFPTPAAAAESSGSRTSSAQEAIAAEPALSATPLTFETHSVQAGETLSGIAALYDVSTEELIALNNLDNPDTLEVGQVLLIPIPGVTIPTQTPTIAPPTRTPLPAPTLEVAGTPTTVPGDPDLQILTVVGAGELQDERVVIRQNGEGLVVLLGWQLQDSDGNVFTFPQVSLFKDGAITVYTKAGTSSVVELYWGLSEAIWASGEVVSLVDPDGNIVSAFQVP